MEVEVLIQKQSQENIDEISQAESLGLDIIPEEVLTDTWCKCTISTRALRESCFAYWFKDKGIKQIRIQLAADDGGVLFLTYTNELWDALVDFHKGVNNV